MAVDMFLKIADVEGESKDDAHKNSIDVLSWSWGMNQTGSGHAGGGGGTGKVQVHDVTVTKYVDKSTPDLMLACCNGKHFKEAKITNRKAGENPLEYLVVTMSDVLITSVQTGGQNGNDKIMETLSLNFAKVKVDYAEQTATGGKGATPKMGWDIEANKKM